MINLIKTFRYVCIVALSCLGCGLSSAPIESGRKAKTLIDRVDVLDFVENKVDTNADATKTLVSDINKFEWRTGGGKPPGAPDWYLQCFKGDSVKFTIEVYGRKILYDAKSDRFVNYDGWKKFEEGLQ